MKLSKNVNHLLVLHPNSFKDEEANYTPKANNHITIQFVITINNKKAHIKLLIDSSSIHSFMCKNFAKVNKIP